MAVTAAQVKAALLRRYGGPRLDDERYVCIEEARSGAGFEGNKGSCDFLAINTHKGRGMELIGHEVKVSLQDWKRELAAPEKAEMFARYCRRWWVAVPADLAAKIRDEVPPQWGLLSLSEKGRWTEVQKAPVRKGADPVPDWWWVAWLAQFDRQAKRRARQMVVEGMEAERVALNESVTQQVESRLASREQRLDELQENAVRLKDAVGIDLQRVWPGNLDRLKAAWDLVQSGYDVKGLIVNLRRTADSLEGITLEDG